MEDDGGDAQIGSVAVAAYYSLHEEERRCPERSERRRASVVEGTVANCSLVGAALSAVFVFSVGSPAITGDE